MELFLSFSPSNETREAFMSAAEAASLHAKGEPHRYESLHSTLVYIGEKEESCLPELRAIVGEVCARHHALPVEGEGIVVDREMMVYDAWGLLYMWNKTPEVQALFTDMRDTLTEKGYLHNYNRDYVLHSTLWMTYFPEKGYEDWTPPIGQVSDCFDRVTLYQVTVIDGHVAYYPLYEAPLR